MNDPGLDKPIREGFQSITHILRDKTPQDCENQKPVGPTAEFRCELEVDDDEEEVGFDQPKRWWFTSTAFPLIAGTFGPLANLFAVCALAQTWRVAIPPRETETKGTRIKDPAWLLVLNAVSLVLALVANLFLLLNFAHRVRYSLAQSVTIGLWYTAAVLLIIPLGMTHDLVIHPTSSHAFAQSYYYAIISATLYITVSSLLAFNAIGAYFFHAYPPSFNSLTIPQRTLMLQATSYILYLALGAGVFSAIEGWTFCDGLYWADYTLLTIGLGTDFPLEKTLSRALLIPYAALGITMIGLVVGSVRGLVLERVNMKVVRRNLAKQRSTVIQKKRVFNGMSRWGKEEFECMRKMEDRARTVQQYSALGTSFFAFVVVWLMGALVYWLTEKRPQDWTYFEALYFSYTSLLTIGYGDFYPQSNSGKPFFVVWSLIAVPAVTVLISNLGDTVVGYLKNGLLWVGQRTLLPENHISRGNPAINRHEGSPDLMIGLGKDAERLGEASEKGKQGQGHARSLTIQIAREIRRLAEDVGTTPESQYEWHDWVRWLRLLGMDSSQDAGRASDDMAQHWSWLSDDGPLFSPLTETEWVLRKLCARLEQMLEQELKDACRQNIHDDQE